MDTLHNHNTSGVSRNRSAADAINTHDVESEQDALVRRHNEQLERRAQLNRCTKEAILPVTHEDVTGMTFEKRCITQVVALLESNMPAGFKCELAAKVLKGAL